jgi:putative DNA primase/helicase
MRFEDFASAHGLIVEHVEYGKWARVKTTDKPGKKNGAYLHKGTVAFLQNHATMGEPATWFPDADSDTSIDSAAISSRCAEAARALQEGRQKAANRAGWIMRQCSLERHAYIAGKGFPDELGNVWHREGEQPVLCIPMRVAGQICGVQTVTTDGEKRFLFGQRCDLAEYVIDNKGRDWFVEGYATGLSLRAALSALKVRYRVHVCFSAHNLAKMAGACHGGIVIADNDDSGTGRAAAEKSGRPWLMSPVAGEDANDWHQRLGTFRFSQEVRKAMQGM